ncbi:unnamed protein product [Mesocestoides corti]|uniref:EF-hand domain-containing protein n=1 Tax=Mesocestoides corti TaxID=53468 RepID=A0A0R3UD84_MESCO|nr:unnamed protein product [Mesocestoides corti]
MWNRAAVLEHLKIIDQDGTGTIDAKELVDALGDKEFAKEVARAIIANYDKNGDGELDVDEFCTFLACAQ